jgi:hypothetical protein
MQPAAYRGSTPVFIFENHAEAIIPWAEFRRGLDRSADLVTFDSHTDTMLPFLRWSYGEAERKRLRDFDHRELIPNRMALVDFTNQRSIEDAAKDLWHDEHIQAAQRAGILGDAFVVTPHSPPNAPEQRSGHLHYLGGLCYYGCDKMPHYQDCFVKLSDLAVADEHLVPLFENHTAASQLLAREAPLILDIDLDYFCTEASLRPQRHSLLTSLANRADIITIATEPMYVEDCRIDESIQWESNLSAVLALLGAALISV